MTKNKDLVTRVDGSLSNLLNFDRLHNMVDNLEKRLWDGFEDFGRWHTKVFEEIQPKMALPKVNVIDEPETYKVEIAMAGFGKEDLQLELKDNCLFIKLERKEESEERDRDTQYLLKEISSRSFRRVVRFPLEIEPGSASCSYENGIANCLVGKAPQASEEEPTKIEVK